MILRRFTLSQRFALTIFSVGLILVVPTVMIQTHSARRALEQRVEAGSRVIMDALQIVVRAHLSRQEIPALRRELYELVQHNRMAYIDVFTPDGTPLIRVSNPQHPRGTSRDTTIGDIKDDVLDLSEPIESGPKNMGQLEVGLWAGGLTTNIRRIALDGVFLGLGLSLGLALISWILGRWMVRQLDRFKNALAARAPLDYGHLALEGTTELKALGEAFNQLQDRLKDAHERRDRAERERQDMIQMVIHDLKGPLAGFGMGLEMLRESIDASKDSSQVRTVELMEKAAARLLDMTQSILEYGRLEETAKIRRSLVDLQPIIQRRVEEAGLSARQLHIDLRFSASRGPFPIEGDASLLGRVVDNLIYNALEHTPKGGRITVTLGSIAEGFEIDVQDSGPGISSDEKEVIFEKFRKGQRDSRGVGLGLAFCKLAVERHGGRIGVRNATEGGAVFYFILPAKSRVPLLSA